MDAGCAQGDQASIIGGAINYVKELEQLLQSLEARKHARRQDLSPGAAGCDADRHARRAARAYTGIPDPAELARILYCDGDCDTAAPPPPEWVPDLVNVELLPDYLPASSRSWRDGNITSRPDTSEVYYIDDLSILLMQKKILTSFIYYFNQNDRTMK